MICKNPGLSGTESGTDWDMIIRAYTINIPQKWLYCTASEAMS